MRSLPLRIAVFFILLCFAPLVQAETVTWTGGAGSGTPEWSSPANWGGVAPNIEAGLIFPAVTNKVASNNFPAFSAFGPLTINASGYVLTGSDMTLNGGVFLNGSAATAQLAIPLALATSQGFTVSSSDGVLTQTQTISGAGGLTKAGPGTLAISGTHTYAGSTILAGGLLQVLGTLPPNAVQISGGTLGGTGTVAGITSLHQSAAFIQPGTNGVGILTSNGDVHMTLGDALNFYVNISSANKLKVNGVVDLGAADFNLNLLASVNSTNLPMYSSFVLIENDGTEPIQSTGITLDDYLLHQFPSLINGMSFQLSRVGGFNHNDVILQRVPTVLPTITMAASGSNAFGGALTLTAQVSYAMISDTVSFWDGVTFLGSRTGSGGGQFILTTSALAAGDHTFTAMFDGNATAAPKCSAGLPLTITGGIATTTALTVSGTNPVTLVATLTGGATGKVIFTDNGVELLNGEVMLASGTTATLTTGTLNAGAHSFVAYFSPDAGFLSSASSVVNHTISGATTTTVVTSSGNSVVAGTQVTLTATVASGSAGTVTFYDGAATLGSSPATAGVAAFSTSGLAAGDHAIVAVYAGTAIDLPSTSVAFTQTITPAPGGGSSGGGGSTSTSSGGCGVGSGVSALALGLLLLFGLRLRRD